MADKEVQISKSNTVSAVSSGKKTNTTSSKAPISSVQTKKSLAEKTPFNSKEQLSNPPIREVLEILRVLNANVNSQNERIDKQNERIENLVEGCSYDEYDDSQTQFSETYEDEHEVESNLLFDQDEGASTSGNSIFKVLSHKFQQSEPVDDDVHPDLAVLVNNSFRNGISEDKLEELCKNIHRPQNCDSLVKTRVNQGIWRLLKSYTQTEDSRLTTIQGVLLKASANLIKLIEQLGSMNSEHVELGTTAVALLGHANKMINTKRKDLHKSDLDNKYHYFASASLPYTDLLYGNDTDVNNNVREINNMNRIGKYSGRGGGGGPVRYQGRGRRGYGGPYSRGRGFRGRGRGMNNSRNDNMTQAKNYKPQKK